MRLSTLLVYLLDNFCHGVWALAEDLRPVLADKLIACNMIRRAKMSNKSVGTRDNLLAVRAGPFHRIRPVCVEMADHRLVAVIEGKFLPAVVSRARPPIVIVAFERQRLR